MTHADILEFLNKAGRATASEGHRAATRHGRVTIPTMVRATMERKGGLRRIAAAAGE